MDIGMGMEDFQDEDFFSTSEEEEEELDEDFDNEFEEELEELEWRFYGWSIYPKYPSKVYLYHSTNQ